ncbi:helix-turn-helix domain-containing protein [Streptomyces sp. NPDC047985]|uniref:helix-turn-helix domain-containing protein n=1 Tax=unclassified Streptomyces TaxID=2593676 RepID=UPI00344576EB
MGHQIREDRRPQGRKKLTAERAAYFQLMREGYSNKEACRIVGINPRTGKVWRNGRHAHKGMPKAVPPVYREPSSAGSGRYLRESERVHIADRLREKATIRAIASELSGSSSGSAPEESGSCISTRCR